jgi:glycerol-3-phosphate O-acyltransferase/dihydroxyacetone phosphate acyltransferase
MLRLTAKSTQFGRRTFTSWLIESAGTVPIKRRQDFPGGEADNSQVMGALMDVRPESSQHVATNEPLLDS